MSSLWEMADLLANPRFHCGVACLGLILLCLCSKLKGARGKILMSCACAAHAAAVPFFCWFGFFLVKSCNEDKKERDKLVSLFIISGTYLHSSGPGITHCTQNRNICWCFP